MRLIPPVVNEIKTLISNPELDSQDRKAFEEWMSLESPQFFRGKTLEQIIEWAADNLLPRLDELKAQKAFREAANVPSEAHLEDVYMWVECSISNGSPKQIAWAKSIAHNHHFAIFQAQKAGKPVPTAAK